ncbi:MAG: type VI secretion system baseplate subunit TssF [Caulobacteraceae bacterium]|nr:type VI secretion system baseplate subunit TssF [Caulobacteraceae bacterium]
MDPRLLRAYNEELAYLRESAREFGEEHDVVAGYLGLKTPNDPDPYVERLLEGVAFLSARVNLKLADQFPDFTQHLLSALQPNYIAPTPSICIVALEPREEDSGLVEGVRVERLTELTAPVAGQDTQCVFRTGHPVDLWPLKIEAVEYLPSRAAVAPYASAAGVRAEAGLKIRIAVIGDSKLSDVKPGPLPVYLDGSENIPGELHRQILGETLAVVGRPIVAGGADGAFVKLPKPEPYGFGEDCALLPHEGRSFRGYRLLTEYFACPERFMFAALPGLASVFAGTERECEIVLLFSRTSPILTGAVAPPNLRLFCTPAVNLFEKQLGRVTMTKHQHEYLIMPDRTRPLDFEVFKLLEVTAYGQSNSAPRPVAPLYAMGALLHDWREALFYALRLRPRRLSLKEQRSRRRKDYVGTETWISLTAPGEPDKLDDIYELAVRALCTNRELPELLRFSGRKSDFATSIAQIKSVTAVRAPTRPRPPLGLTDSAWRVIGHLTPNFTALAREDGDAGTLRDHLALYARSDDPAMRRQIDGILEVRSQPVTRRISGVDRLAFARGQRLTIRLDDASFENSRMFLFSAVLDRFLSEFASINSFVETVFESPDQGEFARWPARTGQRPTI